ncbi:MAG: S-methyl-5-thioribose kinase [Rhodospirillales bacterium]
MGQTLATPPGYRALAVEELRHYVAKKPVLCDRLGGESADWRIEEVGDGNLNLVFKLHGPAGGLAIKQALPYVRLVGESWPLPLSRAHYEQAALALQDRLTGGLVPRLLHYDRPMALIAMELLEPHIIMRQGMIAATRYPAFVEAITDFMAKTYFHTCDLALPAGEKKELIATFAGNSALCKITEDLIFTEPFMRAENNRWTSPQLDGMAAALRQDLPAKLAISRLKVIFMTQAQALLHGDLHSGSIMLTADDTRVIDPEFAFVGPIAFDVGALLGNLLLSYFSQDGHESRPGERDGYRDWILEALQGCWTGFETKFLALWRGAAAGGDAYPRTLFDDAAGEAALEAERRRVLGLLFRDTLGFVGAELIRRTLGLAHNIDLEWIENPDRRAACEASALGLARDLLIAPRAFPDVTALAQAARRRRAWRPPLGTSFSAEQWAL